MYHPMPVVMVPFMCSQRIFSVMHQRMLDLSSLDYKMLYSTLQPDNKQQLHQFLFKVLCSLPHLQLNNLSWAHFHWRLYPLFQPLMSRASFRWSTGRDQSTRHSLQQYCPSFLLELCLSKPFISPRATRKVMKCVLSGFLFQAMNLLWMMFFL